MIKSLLLALLFIAFLLLPRLSYASSIVINEFMAHPASGNGSDWIELYNATSTSIDLTNWKLVDSTSTMKTLSGFINAFGFTTFDVGTRLNNAGDSIFLKDSSDNTIDSYVYNSDPGIDKSVGRSPDGSSNWINLTTSSKDNSNGGSANASSAPSPTPTPPPSPTPTNSPSPTPSPSPTIFIANIPSAADVNQQFNINVTLSNFPPSINLYLKGAFKKSGSSNYFGQTLVNNTWVRNYQTYTSQLPINTDVSGAWSGNLTVKGDHADSGYTGEGDYIFKVGFYQDSVISWGNESTIHLSGSLASEALSQSTPAPETLSKDKKTTSQDTPSPATPNPTRYRSTLTRSLDLLGLSLSAPAATPSPSPVVNVKATQVKNILLIIAGVFCIIGAGWFAKNLLLKRFHPDEKDLNL